MGSGNQKNGKSSISGLNSRVIGICLALLFIFIFEFFLRTWCGVQCIRIGYEITEAMEQRERLREQKENLEIEITRLTSPKILNQIAGEQYGLATPKPEQIVVIP